jgi:pimeloyl-ACP methyl ester carboxylesterase
MAKFPKCTMDELQALWSFTLRSPFSVSKARKYRAGVLPPWGACLGEDDTLAPPQYAKELAEGMPGSRLRLYPGEGHISILDHPIKEIVESLLAP